jgi:hypothetical protein
MTDASAETKPGKKRGKDAAPAAAAAAADRDSANEHDDKSEKSGGFDLELRRSVSSEVQELSPEEATRAREKGKGKVVQSKRRTDSASSLRCAHSRNPTNPTSRPGRPSQKERMGGPGLWPA